MMQKCVCSVFISLLLILPTVGLGADLKTAMEQAADYFEKTATKIEGRKSVMFRVVNQLTQNKDRMASKIETELYFAFERRFTGYRLFLDSDRKAELLILGMYETRGNTIHIKLQAFQQNMSGEILGQTEVTFSKDKELAGTLVAVLDLDAETLSITQRKAFSDVFRSSLFRKKAFNIVNSAEVDKFDPEKIQDQTKCTRDECAVIIGEQLGVDRVVSSSLRKISDDLFILSGKIVDVKNGSIHAATTVKHSGRLITLDQALETLAHQLTTDDPDSKALDEIVDARKDEAKYQQGFRMDWMHITAISVGVLSGALSWIEASKVNNLIEENNDIRDQYVTTSKATIRDSLKSSYDSNQQDIDQMKDNIMMYDTITVIVICIEVYRLVFEHRVFSAVNDHEPSPFYVNIIPQTGIYGQYRQATIGFQWKW